MSRMQTTNEKIKKAIEIFKTQLSGAKGKFRAFVSETNGNEVEFVNDSGLYCIINVRSMRIRGI